MDKLRGGVEKLSLGHYVYVHRKKDDGTVFYVGKGQNDRAWSIDGRNRDWVHAAVDHGRTVELVRIGLTEKAAFDLERSLIAEYRRSGVVLANIHSGGNGARSTTFGKRIFPPEMVMDGRKFWNWKKNARRNGWHMATIDEMISDFGGSHDDWQNVINGITQSGPKGWRLFIPRNKT